MIAINDAESRVHAREGIWAYRARWLCIGLCAGFWIAVINLIVQAVFS